MSVRSLGIQICASCNSGRVLLSNISSGLRYLEMFLLQRMFNSLKMAKSTEAPLWAILLERGG